MHLQIRYLSEIQQGYVFLISGFLMILCRKIAMENNLSETAFTVKEND